MGLFDKLRHPIREVKKAYKEADEYEEWRKEKKEKEEPKQRFTKEEIEILKRAYEDQEKAKQEPLPEPEPEEPETKAYMPLGKSGILKGQMIDPNIKQPILLLINEDRTVTIKENAHTGENEVKFPNGQTGFIALVPEKLLSIPWGSGQLLCWIHYVRETISYPTDTVHDSETIGGIMQTIIVSNEKYRNKTMEGWIKLAWMLGIIIIVLLAVYAMFLLPAQTAQQLALQNAANTIAQNVTNVTV